MITINISLPKQMYQDAKKLLARGQYASISELIRDALRQTLYPKLTENGFTEEFEDAILESAAEPTVQFPIWKTQTDIDNYFDKLHRRLEKIRHA